MRFYKSRPCSLSSISCVLCAPHYSHDRPHCVPRVCQACSEVKTLARALPSACTLVVHVVTQLASPLSGFHWNGTSLEWSSMTTKSNRAPMHCTLLHLLHHGSLPDILWITHYWSTSWKINSIRWKTFSVMFNTVPSVFIIVPRTY